MQNINFYDPALRYRRDWTGPEAALAALAVAAAALAAAGGWARHQAGALQAPAAEAATARQATQDALAALQARRSSLKADAALEHRLLDLQATLAHRQAALKLLGQGALRHDSGYSAALLALARQSVDGLWLTGLAMDSGSMTLRGRALRPELIAVYVGRLNGETALQGHAFRALEVRRPLDEAAPVGAAAVPAVQTPQPPPQPQATAPAARRLAPYVEFSLNSARDEGADAALAAADGGAAAVVVASAASSAGGAAPAAAAGSRP